MSLLRASVLRLVLVLAVVANLACDRQHGNHTLPHQVDKPLVKAIRAIRFEKKKAAENLSDAAVLSDGRLLIVSDEGREFVLLDAAHDESSVVDLVGLIERANLPAPKGRPDEIDLESAAVSGSHIILVGSASLKRPKPKPGKPGNAERISAIIPASGEGFDHSNYVFTLRAEGPGKAPTIERAFDLRAALLTLPMLAPFRELPSKDNGIDVEGAAIVGESYYFGLRGPVLRGNALIVRTGQSGEHPEPSFLDLDGLGVRGLFARPDGSMFVLAGPTLEVEGPFVLYRWDGKHSVFRGEKSDALVRLGELERRDVKPEGLFPWREHLCFLSDGVEGGDVSCTDLAVR